MDHLQPVDLTFNRTVAPPQRQRGSHGRLVLPRSGREATELTGHARPLGVRHPVLPVPGVAVAHHAGERTGQLG